MADTLSLPALTLPSLPSHSAAFACAHMDCSRSRAIVPVRVHVRVFLGLADPMFVSGGVCVCVCDQGGWSVVSAVRLHRHLCACCAAPAVIRVFEAALTRVGPVVPDPAHPHSPIHSTPPSRISPLASRPFVLTRARSSLFAPVCIHFRLLGLACVHSGSVRTRVGSAFVVRVGARHPCSMAIVVRALWHSSSAS